MLRRAERRLNENISPTARRLVRPRALLQSIDLDDASALSASAFSTGAFFAKALHDHGTRPAGPYLAPTDGLEASMLNFVQLTGRLELQFKSKSDARFTLRIVRKVKTKL